MAGLPDAMDAVGSSNTLVDDLDWSEWPSVRGAPGEVPFEPRRRGLRAIPLLTRSSPRVCRTLVRICARIRRQTARTRSNFKPTAHPCPASSVRSPAAVTPRASQIRAGLAVFVVACKCSNACKAATRRKARMQSLRNVLQWMVQLQPASMAGSPTLTWLCSSSTTAAMKARASGWAGCGTRY